MYGNRIYADLLNKKISGRSGMDEMLTGHKKELKRIDWDIVKRVIMLLYHDAKIKRTNLAMKANMSYTKCILYLEWLEMIDLIRIEMDIDGSELIILSDKGRELYERKYKILQNTVV
ncbi:MAG: hypothetical protein ACREBJ_11315 [Nitrosotalea sp.]